MAVVSAPGAVFTDLGPDEALEAYYRIVRVPSDHFKVDGYRYPKLADAMAQSRRGRAADRG
jgi:hypothetical protein